MMKLCQQNMESEGMKGCWLWRYQWVLAVTQLRRVRMWPNKFVFFIEVSKLNAVA